MRYLIYLRVSTEKQDEEMQRHHCMNHIRAVNRDNAPIIEYVDPDVSSRVKMDKRPALSLMLQDIRKGDVVVTFKLDRISRDIIEMVTIYRLVRDKKAQVYSISEPNIEEWMLGIFASFAQKEREDISMRTKAKMQELKSKGVRLGKVPYGQRLDAEGRIEADPEEAAILKKMYSYRMKKQDFRTIAARLNADGLYNRPTKKRAHVPWTYGAVGRVYANYLKVVDGLLALQGQSRYAEPLQVPY